jgi:uncharacterized protein
MNAVAGGGTLVTFPALVAWASPHHRQRDLHRRPLAGHHDLHVGLPPRAAGARRWAIAFAIPSLLGGIVGAGLLLVTPEKRFAAIVPWLILGATTLFMAQGPLLKPDRDSGPRAPHQRRRRLPAHPRDRLPRLSSSA